MKNKVTTTNAELNCKIEPIAKLDCNEFPFNPAPGLLSNDIHAKQLTQYPDADCSELRQKLAELNTIHPDNILITAGSSEAIQLVLLTQPSGTEIIVSAHSFQLYQTCARNNNLKVTVIKETELWEQNLGGILNAISASTSLIFITNPSNPLGTWISNQSLEAFLKAIPSNIIVVIDEAYFEFMIDVSLYRSSIEFLERHHNIVILRTFSKAYGLAGGRIGFVIANLNVIKMLKSYQLPFSVSSISMYYAISALDHISYYQDCANRIINTRHFLYFQLKHLGFNPLANSANFITFKFGNCCQKFVQILKQQGVFIRCLDAYNLADFVRVSIGEENDIILFLDNLINFIEIISGSTRVC